MAAVCSRPLKKHRLCAPDVYPQEHLQKEDELSEENVKKGFTFQPLFKFNLSEYGSAKDIVSNVPLSKFAQSFNAVRHEKVKLNTFQDSNKRKSQIVKENFWNVTARSRSHIASWFQDLTGNKPLTLLAKKVPIFNKKEEIFSSLCDYAVPLLRAAWFIKMTSAYYNAISEPKVKKRIAQDPAQEWTHVLTKYLREQLMKLSDFYHQHFASQHQPRMTSDVEQAQKQWNYTIRLANWLYEESLLDRQEFLQWLLDLLDKGKMGDDVLLKLLIPLVLKYVDQIVLSQTLARNLGQVCTRKLASLYSAAEQMQSEQQQQQNATSSSGPKTPTMNAPSPLSTSSESIAPPTSSSSAQQPIINQYKNCPQHQALLLAFSSLLETITICCPGALVWNSAPCSSGSNSSNDNGANKLNVLGSPLDRIPIAVSDLPLPSSVSGIRTNLNQELTAAIMASEEEIKTRSKAVENQWSPDKYEDKTSSLAVKQLLDTLEILDKFNFNKTEAGSSVDILYLKIFANSSKGTMQVSETDQAVSLLLCEWAVSKHRVGKHRVLVVAKLLQKRQMDLQDEVEDNVGDTGDDTASSAVSVQTQSLPPFQKVLLNFLDNYAPVVDDYQHHKGDPSFAQLILLFGELIRHDVFSHNAYLHTLIARGDLQPPPVVSVPSPPKPTLDPSLNTSGLSEQLGTEVCVQEGDATGIVDLTIPGIINVKEDEGENKRETSDSEFKLNQELDQELLLHQERLQQLLDQGDNESFLEDSQLMQPLSTTLSVDGIKLDAGQYSSINLNRRDSTLTDSSSYSKKTQHVQYATHFPIPQDSATQHECNQRLILLYGVGRARSEAIATAKEVNKLLLNKLQELNNVPTSQRNSREYAKCSSSAELSAKRAQEEQRANLYGKFTSLSGFDQYNTVAKCASFLRDMKAAQPNYFGLGGPLPVIDQLVFMFDLFELSGDIHGLLDFIVQALMPQEEKVMHSAVPQTTSVFGTLPNKSITVVAILRRYHAFLMTLPQHTARVFRGLLQTVENIADPGVCTSSERCILAYLFDLYSGCAHLRTRYSDIFSYAHTRIKQSVCASNNPSVSTEQFDLKFMAEYFQNPRTKRLDRIWEYLRSYDRRADVYSFVCNALMNVCNCQSSERLFDIGVLCAEVTSHFGRLCSEWLGVLKALCCSSNSSLGFVDLLLEVDVGDLSIHESVATFTALLISRRSLSLEDVIYHVALSSLKAALPGSDNNQDAESGARLTCHLLLRLLDESTDFMSHDHSEATKFPFKSSPDHYLLTAAHENISVTALLAVLKAMLKLSESGRTNDLGNNETSRDELFRSSSFSSRLYGFMDSAGDIFPPPMSSSKSAMETSNTSAFAGYALQVICGQEWVREKCLQDLQAICSPKLLLDPALTANQARKLLHLICYPAGVPMSLGGTIPLLSSSSEMESAQEAASRILQNLDQWSLRKSWLELQLMIRQASKEETSSLLDAIATGAMNVFVQWHGATPLATARSNQRRGVIKGPEWLVAPLISKLSNLVQGRLLKAAGDVLDSPKWWKEHKEHGSKKSGCALVHTQPFLSLVLACLKGQEDQRGGLLSSISRQLSKLLAAPVEERCPVASKGKEALQEALHLRLSLVGAMFDTLHRNAQLAAEWAVVLFQLVSSGTITADSFPNKRELLPNVLDMVSVLISVVANSGESSGTQSAEESRKATATLFKKLKRELAGKNPSDITQCKELLPLPSLSYNVMTVEPVRESSEAVSEKPSTSPLPQGLVVQGKQKIGAWELMEGHKNPAPLAWAWFGAVKIERKPLKYEQEFRKLMHHTHPMRKPLSYYINPAPDDEEEEEDEEEEDEDEDEEDKMDADESGVDKSSQPSTPFTPVESKGQAPKPLGNPATPSSVAASAQIVPSSLTQDQIEATGNKQVKAKTQRQRRRPSRTQGVATQQRKQQQLKQQQQQQQYLQQQQQQQQQPGMYMTQPGQPLPQQMNQGQFYQQMSSANTLPGQAQLTVPSRVGTTMGSMDSKTALQSMLATRNNLGDPQLQRLFALKKQRQAKQQQQQQQSTQCLYPNLTQQLQQPAMQPLQLQGSQMQQTQLPQQLQRPIQQPQQQTQRLGHLPQTQHSTVRSNQGSVMRPSQQFSFSQAQRAQLPTSLQIPNRTQVATRPTIASTPTPTTPTIGSMVSSGPNITAQFSNNTFAGLSQTMTRQLAPQQQAQQQQPQQQQQQQQQFTVQNQHSLPGSAVVQRRNQLTASAVGLQMSQASQMQQGLQQQFQSNVGRVNVQQTQQQQQLLRQHLQQRQQQQQAAAARQQQNTQMNTDFIRQLSQMSGGSQDTLSSLERQFSNQELASIQRQLSAPAEMGLQRQVSTGQDISQFQRQLSTPGPQELPQQQQQQFPGNPQFQGQF